MDQRIVRKRKSLKFFVSLRGSGANPTSPPPRKPVIVSVVLTCVLQLLTRENLTQRLKSTGWLLEPTWRASNRAGRLLLPIKPRRGGFDCEHAQRLKM